MAAISTKWKSMGKEEQQIYMEKENKDRKRFQRESVDADAKAIAIQQERRDNLVAQKNKDVSKRGARMKVATEERLSEMDSDELKERQRRKALKKAQTAERQRKRDYWALTDCHSPLVEVLSFFCWALLPYYLCDGFKWSGIVALVAAGFVVDLYVIGNPSFDFFFIYLFCCVN